MNLLLLPVIVVALFDAVDVVVEVATVKELVAVVTLTGESGCDIGDDGGDVFMSSSNGDLLIGFAFGAPFKAELLPSCK